MQRDLGGLLGSRDFLLYWTGQAASQFGSAMHWLAFPLWVLSLSGSTLAAGAAFALPVAVNMLLSPLAGAVADRTNPKLVVLVADLLRGALVCLLFLVHRADQLWIAYLVTAGLSLLGACFLPGQAVIMRRLLDKEQLPSANGLLSASQSASTLLGPVLGGVAAGLIGYHGVFALNAGSFFLSSVAVLLIRLRAPEASVVSEQRRVLLDLVAGLQEAWRNPALRAVLTGTFFLTLALGANTVLFLKHFRDVGLSHAAIGTIASAEGLGMLLSSAVLGLFARTVRTLWRVLLASAMVEGLAILIITYSVPGLMVVAYAGLTVAGICGMATALARRTLLQVLTPESLVGRVTGIGQFVLQGAMLVATTGGSAAAEWFPVPAVLSASGMILAGGAGVAMLLPQVRDRLVISKGSAV